MKSFILQLALRASRGVYQLSAQDISALLEARVSLMRTNNQSLKGKPK